jgi:hypothetical protein
MNYMHIKLIYYLVLFKQKCFNYKVQLFKINLEIKLNQKYINKLQIFIYQLLYKIPYFKHLFIKILLKMLYQLYLKIILQFLFHLYLLVMLQNI